MSPDNTSLANPAALPEGAELIEPVRLKTGSWIEMTVDAKLTYKGITWYRAQGGFGTERRLHPREDWIARLPTLSLHAGRYLTGPTAGWSNYGVGGLSEDTIWAAMDAQIEQNICWVVEKIDKARQRLEDLYAAERILLNAVR